MPPPPRTPAELRAYIKTCWICLALSVLALGYAASCYVRERAFVARAVHVQGKIAVNVHVTGRNSEYYTAIFKFVDGAGKTWEVRDRASNHRSSAYTYGAPCAVVYDPVDPSAAQLETPGSFLDTIGYASVPGFTGLIVGTIALLALRKHYAAAPAAARGRRRRDASARSGDLVGTMTVAMFRSLKFYRADWVVVPLVVGLLGAGLWLHVRRSQLFAHGTHVQGTVADPNRQTHYFRDGRPYDKYEPFLSFTDTGGKTWTFDSGTATIKSCKTGDKMLVVYDPDDPAGAQVEDDRYRPWGGGFLVFCGGCALFLRAGFGWIAALPVRKRLPATPAGP